ncbi:MAG: hypothetical protein ACLTE2_02460 [Eubacteriales bacterium]
MSTLTFGYAMCGSFCTFKQSLEQMKKIVADGYQVVPIMSPISYTTDTRFGKAKDFIERNRIDVWKKNHTLYCRSRAN